MSINDKPCVCGHQEDEHNDLYHGMGHSTTNCRVPGCECRAYDEGEEVDEVEDPD